MQIEGYFENEIWGKLQSLNEERYNSQNLIKQQTTLGRADTNDICIPDKRLSGSHCQIIKNGTQYFLEDLSTNGTFIDDKKIGKGNITELKNGDTIYILHKTKVHLPDILGFVFLEGPEIIPSKRKNSQPIEIKKQMKENEIDLQQFSELVCQLCNNIIYQCVTLNCSHNFCGACLSD